MGRLEFTDRAIEQWGRLQPGEDLAPLAVMLRLLWLGRLSEELLNDVATAHGFRRRGDYEVAALLRRLEPESPSPIDLALQLRVSPSGVTGKVDRLAAAGVVERIPDPIDRRQVRLKLTEAGRVLVDETFGASLAMAHRATAALADSDIAYLDEKLAALLRELDLLSLSR